MRTQIIEVDINRDYIRKDIVRIIADYLLVKRASAEQIERLEQNLRQIGWTRYREGNLLISLFRWEYPNDLIRHLVPVMTNKRYESQGCDFPSAEIFEDIAYVILGMRRPEKKLKQVLVAKEIVDFIHNQASY